MNRFTIKDIENLSGIKAHTWRIWEQRYAIGIPKRKDSNQRYYDNENLKEILCISFLYHHGLKISKIASLGTEGIRKLALSEFANVNQYDLYVHQLINAAINFDEIGFDKILTTVFSLLDTEEVIENIIYRFAEKMGQLWLTNHAIPAQEHFTSNILRQKLANAIESLPYPDSTAAAVLIFAPAKEFHEIPLQYVHYLLRKKNINAIYLGVNTPLQILADSSSALLCDTFYFHLITQLHTDANQYLRLLSKKFPGKKIVMSGPQTALVTESIENVDLLTSLQHLKEYFINR